MFVENGTTHVIVVGGGLAGLAAASALARHGVRVTLLESRPRLGGRASSFVDQTTGEAIDNCQHVSMGCCTNFAHLCRTVGIDSFFREERELYFVGPDGTVNPLRESVWPAPLHLAPAFRQLNYLSGADRAGIGRALRALAQPGSCDDGRQNFADWLRQQGQTRRSIDRFWHVVLVSALSETLDRIDVRQARKVFLDAFLCRRSAWRLSIPTVPLDELYGRRLSQWLTDRGVTIRLKAGVDGVLTKDGNRADGVLLRSGEQLAADFVVLAVPHHRLLPLLPDEWRQEPAFAGTAQLESAPISSVHLWFDQSITPLPHAVFVDRLSQWMFNRTALQRRQSRGESGDRSACNSGLSTLDSGLSYYQIVISASRNLAGQSREETIAEVVEDLQAVWPETARVPLRHSRLVTEHRAVFSAKPGAEEYRPPQQSPIDNLQLAGDWTRTGWPATMEGAVRSGYLAAENVLAQFGYRQRLLQPDLPVSWLTRKLLGMSTGSAYNLSPVTSSVKN